MKSQAIFKIFEAILNLLHNEPWFYAVHSIHTDEKITYRCILEDLKHLTKNIKNAVSDIVSQQKGAFDPDELFLRGSRIWLTGGLDGRVVLPEPPKIPGGMGIRHARRIKKGTLGFMVPKIRVNRSGGETVEVSNALIGSNHVLTDFERATIGDPIMVESDDEGYRDLATLKAWQPLRNTDSALDVAIAEASDQSEFREMYIQNIGEIKSRAVDPIPGMAVKKNGIGSDKTEGIIEGFSTFFIDVNGERLPFRNQIRFSPGFSTRGDSGAIVVDEDNALVGIITSANRIEPGTEDRAYSYATPWSKLGLEFIE